tara:strand:- start:2071 stop:2316 length:246 start_codon:yes stop_codon:yes gene_type:complete
MPRYTYWCKKCDRTFQTAHSIKEKLYDCDGCDSEGSLERLPSMPFVFFDTNQAGKLVDQHIKEAKEEIQEEKDSLKTVEHK